MKLDYAAILKNSWEILLKNVQVNALLVVIFTLVSFVYLFISGMVGANLIGFIVFLVLIGVEIFLHGGFLKILLKMVDGGKPVINELWSNGRYFKELLVVWLAILGIRLIFSFISMLGISLPFGNIISLVVALVTIYIALRLWFANYYVVDKNMKGVDAIKASWDKTRGSVLVLFVAFLLLIVLNFVGFLALLVGLFVTIPLSYIAVTVTYRKFQS